MGIEDEGFQVGALEGTVVGLSVGIKVGSEVGFTVGLALLGKVVGSTDGSDVGLALLGKVVGDALEGKALEGDTLGVDGCTDDGKDVVGSTVGDVGPEVGSTDGLTVGVNRSHCLFASTCITLVAPTICIPQAPTPYFTHKKPCMPQLTPHWLRRIQYFVDAARFTPTT